MRLTKRRWLWLSVLLGLAAVPAVLLFGKWREAGRRGGQQPAEPFRIAGNFYYVGSLTLIATMGIVTYPGYQADFERTFRVLRSLPADIWVTTHARHFGRYRKFLERAKAKDPVAPFIDRVATSLTSTARKQDTARSSRASGNATSLTSPRTVRGQGKRRVKVRIPVTRWARLQKLCYRMGLVRRTCGRPIAR